MGLIFTAPSKRHFDVFSGYVKPKRTKECQTDDIEVDRIDFLIEEMEFFAEFCVDEEEEDDSSLAIILRGGRASMAAETRTLSTQAADFMSLVGEENYGALMAMVNQKILKADEGVVRRASRTSLVASAPPRRTSHNRRISSEGPHATPSPRKSVTSSRPPAPRRSPSDCAYQKRPMKDPKTIGTIQIGDAEWITNARIVIHEIVLALITRFCNWKLNKMNAKTFAVDCTAKGWPKASKFFDKYVRAGNGPNILTNIERENNLIIVISDWEDGVERNIHFQFQGETRSDAEKGCKTFLSKLTPDILKRSQLPGNMRGGKFYDAQDDLAP